MVSARLNLPNDADALKKFRDEMARKRAAAAKKSKVDDASNEGASAPFEHVYTSSPEKSPAKKKQKRSSAAEKGERVESTSQQSTFASLSESPTASSGLSSFSTPAAFLKKSTDFILAADEKFLKAKRTEEVLDTIMLTAFQALQRSLQLHERFKVMSERCGKQKKSIDILKMEKAKVDKTVEELQQKNMALEKELLEVKTARDRHAQESTEARAEVDEQKSLIVALEDRLTTIVSTAICKAKVELFQEYLSGHHDKWDVAMMQEMVNLYEEMKRMEESSPGQDDEQALAENALPEGANAVNLPLTDPPLVDSTLVDPPANPSTAAPTVDSPASPPAT